MLRNESVRIVRIKTPLLLELIHPRTVLVLRQGLKRLEKSTNLIKGPIPPTASLQYLVARSIITSEIPHFPNTGEELKSSTDILLQVHLLISEWITQIHGTNFCSDFRHILTEVLALASICEHLDAQGPLETNHPHLLNQFREVLKLQVDFIARYFGNRTLDPAVEAATYRSPPQLTSNEPTVAAIDSPQLCDP